MTKNKNIFGNNVHYRTAVVLRLLDQTEVSSRADRLSACRAILYIAQVGKAKDAYLFANYNVHVEQKSQSARDEIV